MDDQQSTKLKEMAGRLGMSIDDLIILGFDDLLPEPDEAFLRAVDSVMQKNGELYRRLA